jgi:hypothetical protein
MAPSHRNAFFLLALLNDSNTAINRLVLLKRFTFRYGSVQVFPNGALLKQAISVSGVSDLYSAVKRLKRQWKAT